MKTCFCLTLTVAAMFLACGPALSGAHDAISGQKIDSGLGELPHYSTWADPAGRLPMGHRILGESLDDGLADLPHYSKWIDRSGRNPLGLGVNELTVARR